MPENASAMSASRVLVPARSRARETSTHARSQDATTSPRSAESRRDSRIRSDPSSMKIRFSSALESTYRTVTVGLDDRGDPKSSILAACGAEQCPETVQVRARSQIESRSRGQSSRAPALGVQRSQRARSPAARGPFAPTQPSAPPRGHRSAEGWCSFFDGTVLNHSWYHCRPEVVVDRWCGSHDCNLETSTDKFAEGEGFEPSVGDHPTVVFKTTALGHYASPPSAPSLSVAHEAVVRAAARFSPAAISLPRSIT